MKAGKPARQSIYYSKHLDDCKTDASSNWRWWPAIFVQNDEPSSAKSNWWFILQKLSVDINVLCCSSYFDWWLGLRGCTVKSCKGYIFWARTSFWHCKNVHPSSSTFLTNVKCQFWWFFSFSPWEGVFSTLISILSMNNGLQTIRSPLLLSK